MSAGCCPTPVGFVEKWGGIHPVACGRWVCPWCGKWRKKRLADRVARGFIGTYLQGDKVRALTLTQKLGTQQDIMKNWARLRAVFAKYQVPINKYFWVKEFTKQGERHLHILIDADSDIDQNWLSDKWRTITDGESYILWINEAEIGNAAGYAMKYLTKAFFECEFRPKEKRFGFSQSARFKDIEPILGDFWDIIIEPCGKFTLTYVPCEQCRHKCLPGEPCKKYNITVGNN